MEMKKADVKSAVELRDSEGNPVLDKFGKPKKETKVVATVEFPFFDETNESLGLSEIEAFDWANYFKPAGYRNWKHAVVCLINTQYATNIKNDARSRATGRVTSEQLMSMALAELAKLAPAEMQQLAMTGGMVKWIEDKKAELEKKWYEDRQSQIREGKLTDASSTGGDEGGAEA